MPASHPESSSRWFPLHAAAVLGLFLASLDVSLGILDAGSLHMHPALAALLPVTLCVYLGCWLFVAWPLARWRRMQTMPLAVALAALFLPPATVLTLAGFVDFDAALAARFTKAGQLQLAVLFSIGLANALIVHRLVAAGTLLAGTQRRMARISMAAAVAAFAFAVTVWQHERLRGAESFAVWELAPFLVVCVLLGWIAFRDTGERRLLAGLYACTGMALMAPLWLSGPGPAVPIARGSDSVGEPRLVLLVTVDTLRRDALSIYAEDAGPTPAFDSLARDGLLYEDAYASAPWTLPSLASLHTGLPETVHGMTAQSPRLPEGIRTLAQTFAANGFRTAAIGSNPWLGPGGLARGFDEVDFFPRARYRSAGSSLVGRMLDIEDVIEPGTEELTNRALSWIESHADAPAFLWLHYFDPHSPYEPPPELLPEDEGMGEFHEPYRVMSGSWQTRASDKRRIRQLYDAEVRHVDRHLGRLLDMLKARGLYDEALIVLTADHGEEFWDHDTAFHGHSLFEEVLQVPLIMKPPASLGHAGQSIGTRVSNASVASTLMALSELEAEGWDAFFPQLPLDASGPEMPVFTLGTEYFERRQAVLYGRHKLVLHLDSDRRELYDLSEDPLERRDQADLEPERVAELETLLREHSDKSAAAREALTVRASGETELPDEVRENLRALGYVE